MDSEGSGISAADASGGALPAAARFRGMIRLLPYCLSLCESLGELSELSRLSKPVT